MSVEGKPSNASNAGLSDNLEQLMISSLPIRLCLLMRIIHHILVAAEKCRSTICTYAHVRLDDDKQPRQILVLLLLASYRLSS